MSLNVHRPVLGGVATGRAHMPVAKVVLATHGGSSYTLQGGRLFKDTKDITPAAMRPAGWGQTSYNPGSKVPLNVTLEHTVPMRGGDRLFFLPTSSELPERTNDLVSPHPISRRGTLSYDLKRGDWRRYDMFNVFGWSNIKVGETSLSGVDRAGRTVDFPAAFNTGYMGSRSAEFLDTSVPEYVPSRRVNMTAFSTNSRLCDLPGDAPLRGEIVGVSKEVVDVAFPLHHAGSSPYLAQHRRLPISAYRFEPNALAKVLGDRNATGALFEYLLRKRDDAPGRQYQPLGTYRLNGELREFDRSSVKGELNWLMLDHEHMQAKIVGSGYYHPLEHYRDAVGSLGDALTVGDGFRYFYSKTNAGVLGYWEGIFGANPTTGEVRLVGVV